jgi:hypothetical protein
LCVDGFMKYVKAPRSICLLLFLIAGIAFFAHIVQTQKQDAEIAMAKSNAIHYDSPSKEGPNFLTEFSNGLPAGHVEPLLLFMLGTILLSVVTGINMLRSRKVEFPLPSVKQANLPGQPEFGAQKSSTQKNEAA